MVLHFGKHQGCFVNLNPSVDRLKNSLWQTFIEPNWQMTKHQFTSFYASALNLTMHNDLKFETHLVVYCFGNHPEKNRCPKGTHFPLE